MYVACVCTHQLYVQGRIFQQSMKVTITKDLNVGRAGNAGDFRRVSAIYFFWSHPKVVFRRRTMKTTTYEPVLVVLLLLQLL